MNNLETHKTEKKNSIPIYPHQIALCFWYFNMKKLENRENNVLKVLATSYTIPALKRREGKVTFTNIFTNVLVETHWCI